MSNAVGGVVSSPGILTVSSAAPSVVQLSFTEGTGKNTTNACAYFGNEVITFGTPGMNTFVPVGPYAPNTNFNRYSLYVGASGGSRGVDLYTTNSLPPPTAPQNAGQPNWMGTFSAFTICGWINVINGTYRTAGGNGGLGSAIFHCSDPLNSQPNGIELTYKGNGELFCGINDDNNNAYLMGSMGTVGANDLSVPPGTAGYQGVWGTDFTGTNHDWVFFAVTWQGGLPPTTPSMQFYFGPATNAAALDPISLVPTNQLGVAQTTIPNTGQGTVGGLSPIAGSSRSNSSGADSRISG